eukprot:3628876-Amphidinium_carterae.1
MGVLDAVRPTLEGMLKTELAVKGASRVPSSPLARPTADLAINHVPRPQDHRTANTKLAPHGKSCIILPSLSKNPRTFSPSFFRRVDKSGNLECNRKDTKDNPNNEDTDNTHQND